MINIQNKKSFGYINPNKELANLKEDAGFQFQDIEPEVIMIKKNLLSPSILSQGKLPAKNISPAETIKRQFEAEKKVYPERFYNQIRTPFALENTIDIPKTYSIGSFITSFVSRVPELAVSLPTAFVNYFRKNLNTIVAGKPIETEQFKSILGKDPKIFGITDENLTDTATLLANQHDIEERNDPSNGNSVKFMKNAIMAVAKTVVPDVMDALFGADIALNLPKLAVGGLKMTARQLPDSLLFKITKQNISPMAIKDVLIGGKPVSSPNEFKIAKKFINGLSGKEKGELYKLADRQPSLGISDISILEKVEPTAIGKFAEAKPPVSKISTQVSGLLKSGSQSGFINIGEISDDIILLAKKAKDSKELENILSSEQLKILTVKGITPEMLFNEVKPKELESKRIQFVSPNTEEGLTFNQAIGNMNTPEYQTKFNDIESSYVKDEVKGNLEKGLGEWGTGAEQTFIKKVVNEISDEKAIYSLAKNAKKLNQIDAIDFKISNAGKDELFIIDPSGKSILEIKDLLNKIDIKFKTLGQDKLYVVNSGEYFDSNMMSKLQKFESDNNLKISKRSGIATFITKLSSDRGLANKIYDDIINKYEQKYGNNNRGNIGIQKNTISRESLQKEEVGQEIRGESGQRAGEGKLKQPLSLEKLGLKQKTPLITKREDVLLRKRIKDEARGAKVGSSEARKLTREELITKFKDSRETVRQIKNDLIKYIDENLPTEAKGKLNQALTRDDLTRKNAASIFSRVERMKETLTRKELVSEIKELSVPKGNLAVDYQKHITEITEGIDLVKPTELTLKKLRGLRDYIQKEGIPLNIQSKYVEKLTRLTKKNVSQLSTAELAELKDTLNQLQKLGKLKQDLKYKYNERERKVALDRLLASTQNIDPKVSGQQTKLDIYKVGTKKVYMDTLHTPRVADMIDGYKGYQGENTKLIKRLGAKETIAKENIRAIVNSALEEIQGLGVEELTKEQQVRMMINIRNKEGAFDQVKTLMEKNGLKEIPELTTQENQIIEIIKKYTNQHTDDIVAIYEEIENTPFDKLKEYILPLKYEKDFNLIPSQAIEHGRYRTTQTFKGFTYERQKGVEKTPRTDILSIFEESINEQQWYLNMQPELENIKYLVKSEEYLAKGGEMASNWWRTELDVVARRGWSATATSNPILRQERINLVNAILGYKASSILMQPFAVFDSMASMQSKFGTTATLEVLQEFSKAWIIPKYAKQIIAESPALQQRQAGELAIEETLKKVGKAKGLRNSFMRNSMSLLQKADVITAAGVQQGIENVLIKHGVPNAKQEAEFLMNLVSGSNEVVYRPHILASGEGARTWFTFQTFFMNRWGIMIHDLIISGVIKGGGATGWERLWKSMSALIGLGIFIAGSIAENQSRKTIYETTTGKKLPDESALKTAVMFIPTQVPYFGNLIEAADRGGDASPPLIRTVENVFKGGAGLIKGKKPETKIKGALKITEAGLTLGAGVPGTAQFFDLMERIFLGNKEKPTTTSKSFGNVKQSFGNVKQSFGNVKQGFGSVKKSF